jgi:hypothetical protein
MAIAERWGVPSCAEAGFRWREASITCEPFSRAFAWSGEMVEGNRPSSERLQLRDARRWYLFWRWASATGKI